MIDTTAAIILGAGMLTVGLALGVVSCMVAGVWRWVRRRARLDELRELAAIAAQEQADLAQDETRLAEKVIAAAQGERP